MNNEKSFDCLCIVVETDLRSAHFPKERYNFYQPILLHHQHQDQHSGLTPRIMGDFLHCQTPFISFNCFSGRLAIPSNTMLPLQRSQRLGRVTGSGLEETKSSSRSCLVFQQQQQQQQQHQQQLACQLSDERPEDSLSEKDDAATDTLSWISSGRESDTDTDSSEFKSRMLKHGASVQDTKTTLQSLAERWTAKIIKVAADLQTRPSQGLHPQCPPPKEEVKETGPSGDGCLSTGPKSHAKSLTSLQATLTGLMVLYNKTPFLSRKFLANHLKPLIPMAPDVAQVVIRVCAPTNIYTTFYLLQHDVLPRDVDTVLDAMWFAFDCHTVESRMTSGSTLAQPQTISGLRTEAIYGRWSMVQRFVREFGLTLEDFTTRPVRASTWTPSGATPRTDPVALCPRLVELAILESPVHPHAALLKLQNLFPTERWKERFPDLHKSASFLQKHMEVPQHTIGGELPKDLASKQVDDIERELQQQLAKLEAAVKEEVKKDGDDIERFRHRQLHSMVDAYEKKLKDRSGSAWDVEFRDIDMRIPTVSGSEFVQAPRDLTDM